MLALMAELTVEDSRTAHLRDDSPLGCIDNWLLLELERESRWLDVLLAVREDYVLRAYQHGAAHRCSSAREAPLVLVLSHENARRNLNRWGLNVDGVPGGHRHSPEYLRVFDALRSVLTWVYVTHIAADVHEHIGGAVERAAARQEFQGLALPHHPDRGATSDQP
jgi:hypothetical protein